MKKWNLAILGSFFLFLAVACKKETITSKPVSLIPVEVESGFQYIDLQGNIVIQPQFKSATAFRDGLALVQLNTPKAKFGFIDKTGKFKIAPDFTKATVFREGVAWTIDESGVFSVIDTKGKVLFVLPNAEEVFIFNEGLAAYRVGMGKDEKWGFVDKNGKIVIEPQFQSVGIFNEGYCKVTYNGTDWGFINNKGKLIINPRFEELSRIRQGRFVAKENGKYGLFDLKGNYIINPAYEDMYLDGNQCNIKAGSKWGWCDLNGNALVSPQFDNMLFFGDNESVPVEIDGKYGFADRSGRLIIKPSYETTFPFYNGLAPVVLDKKVGFIDQSGSYIINPIYKGLSLDYVYEAIVGLPETRSITKGKSDLDN